jgi:hypothetical protein
MSSSVVRSDGRIRQSKPGNDGACVLGQARCSWKLVDSYAKDLLAFCIFAFYPFIASASSNLCNQQSGLLSPCSTSKFGELEWSENYF